MPRDLVSCAQAARRLGIHVSTVRAWARGGRFPVYRHGKRFIRLDWGELLKTLADDVPEGSATDERRPVAGGPQ